MCQQNIQNKWKSKTAYSILLYEDRLSILNCEKLSPLILVTFQENWINYIKSVIRIRESDIWFYKSEKWIPTVRHAPH